MKSPEVASKPPSKGLFYQEPPSELLIQIERHPLMAVTWMKDALKDNQSFSKLGCGKIIPHKGSTFC